MAEIHVKSINDIVSKVDEDIDSKKIKNTVVQVIRFLIDKQGNVYCHKILTDLGDKFILEAEKAIVLLRFSEASIDDRAVAYQYSVPISFIWDSTKKPNRKQKNRYVP